MTKAAPRHILLLTRQSQLQSEEGSYRSQPKSVKDTGMRIETVREAFRNRLGDTMVR
jgi:hypothetical protein